MTGSHLDVLVPLCAQAALIARSQCNIARSCSLVDTADVLIRAARRLRRPRLRGGSDAREPTAPRDGDPRVLRTWSKLESGALPTDGATRRWVGPGRGQRCNGCGDPITELETECEVDFSDTLLLRFHRECFTAWESFDRTSRKRR